MILSKILYRGGFEGRFSVVLVFGLLAALKTAPLKTAFFNSPLFKYQLYECPNINVEHQPLELVDVKILDFITELNSVR